MAIPDHLKIEIAGLNFDALRGDWRWRVPEGYRPLIMTFLGDLFMQDSGGKVFFLDLMCGTFEQVTDSESAFNSLMEDREQRLKWFPGWLFIELKKAQGEPAKGECYTCKVPLTLGGRLEPTNFARCDIAVHYSILGQLQSQIGKLPPGTRIADFRIVDGKISLETDTLQKGLFSKIKGLVGR